MPNVFQCQIELRVPKDKFEEAIKYYQDLFKISEPLPILVEGALAQVAYADFDASGVKGKYSVVIRAMSVNSYQLGPVVHWGGPKALPGSTVAEYAKVIEDELKKASGSTMHLDERALNTDLGMFLRSSGIDTFQNRVGSINPDFPGKSLEHANRSVWGTMLGLLGLGIAGALVWRGASSR
jgi:hypothetical protein